MNFSTLNETQKFFVKKPNGFQYSLVTITYLNFYHH